MTEKMWKPKGSTLIGYISVDSGMILIGDPCCAERINYDAILGAIQKSTGGHVEVNHSVVTYTPDGDGIFPVYRVTKVDGSRQLVIDLGQE